MEAGAAREERAEQWEEHLQALARAAQIDLSALPPAKSDASESLLAAAMKASSSVSNGWLAQRLDMGEPASTSQFARRWRRFEAVRPGVYFKPNTSCATDAALLRMRSRSFRWSSLSPSRSRMVTSMFSLSALTRFT